MARAAEDLTDRVFGTRKVLKRASEQTYKGLKRRYRTIYWKVECTICGTKSEVQGSALKHGDGCRACYENRRKEREKVKSPPEPEPEPEPEPRSAQKDNRPSTKGLQGARKKSSALKAWKAAKPATQRRPARQPLKENRSRPLTAGELQAAISSAYTEDEVLISIKMTEHERHGRVTGVLLSKRADVGQVLLQTSFDVQDET
jgi:hypothetical protein